MSFVIPSSKCQTELSNLLGAGNKVRKTTSETAATPKGSSIAIERNSGRRGTRRGSFKLARQAAAEITEREVLRFKDGARCASTQRKYANVRSKYFELITIAGKEPVPFRAETACIFIISLVRANYVFETVEQYCRIAKQLAREERGETVSPLEEGQIKLYLRAAEKLCVQSGIFEQRRAATLSCEDVRAVASISDPSEQGVITGILVGISALLRVSELLALTIADVTLVFQSAEAARAEIFIARSKTDQLGQGCTIAIGCCCRVPRDPVCPFHRLVEWVKGRQEDERVIPLDRKAFTERMTTIIRRILSDRVPSNNRVSTHSLRRTGAQLLLDQCVDEGKVVEMGRWKSARCLQERYSRDGTYKLAMQSDLTRTMFEGPKPTLDSPAEPLITPSAPERLVGGSGSAARPEDLPKEKKRKSAKTPHRPRGNKVGSSEEDGRGL